MADNSRKISGTVSVQQRSDVAVTAAQMAREMWWEKYKKVPSASDGKYLDLVYCCARALQGEASYEPDFSGHIERIFDNK